MKLTIGTRVKFNANVAFAFVGQPGTIISQRNSPIDGETWIVKLDTPTAPAKTWSLIPELGVTEKCLELL